jgi:hypothetical protein
VNARGCRFHHEQLPHYRPVGLTPNFIHQTVTQDTNIRLLEDLFRRGVIRLNRGQLLSVGLPPRPAGFNFETVEGMMLGLATRCRPLRFLMPSEETRPLWLICFRVRLHLTGRSMASFSPAL